jgi:hypothetical protein
MTQSRKQIVAVVSLTFVLVVGAIAWFAMPRTEKVIELAPIQQQGAQR